MPLISTEIYLVRGRYFYSTQVFANTSSLLSGVPVHHGCDGSWTQSERAQVKVLWATELFEARGWTIAIFQTLDW